MGCRVGWLTIDTLDVERQATFWTAVLGFERLFESDEGIAVVPPGLTRDPGVTGTGVLLYTVGEFGPKAAKNRVHLDLGTSDRAGAVDHARAAGAVPVDIGQGDVSWTVLADPEGNEFCILDDRAPLLDRQAGRALWIDAVAIDVADRDRAAAFWSGLLGWDEVDRDEDSVRLRDPDGKRDDLLLAEVADLKTVKNRVHLDLVRLDDDAEAEIRRAEALGASRVDIGQGEVTWAVMADPDGNEFCLLAPRPLD